MIRETPTFSVNFVSFSWSHDVDWSDPAEHRFSIDRLQRRRAPDNDEARARHGRRVEPARTSSMPRNKDVEKIQI